MQTYHLLIEDMGDLVPRRIVFDAESPDHALHLAERETEGARAELWAGNRLLARMTKAAPCLWKLHPCSP